MSDHQDPEDRQQEIRSAVLKFLGITAILGLVIWIGTSVVVNSLDLDEANNGPITGSGPIAPISQLPTVALPSATPTATASAEPTEVPTRTPSPTNKGEKGLTLVASPMSVGAGQRIDLSGQWPGRDNVSLHVQRFESGEWGDFGVQVQVRVGSYATYILTSRTGENRFRVYDVASGTASNTVTVTVG